MSKVIGFAFQGESYDGHWSSLMGLDDARALADDSWHSWVAYAKRHPNGADEPGHIAECRRLIDGAEDCDALWSVISDYNLFEEYEDFCGAVTDDDPEFRESAPVDYEELEGAKCYVDASCGCEDFPCCGH